MTMCYAIPVGREYAHSLHDVLLLYTQRRCTLVYRVFTSKRVGGRFGGMTGEVLGTKAGNWRGGVFPSGGVISGNRRK